MEAGMTEKKKIPCRVCGKLFVPCAFCQTHDDVFRWRNFACSRECATKYINDTIAYRKSLKNKREEGKNKTEEYDELVKKVSPTGKRTVKKISTNIVESEKTE